MAQLGRIGGPLLDANLHRDGVDLKFSNTTFDSTPILFLDVENGRIGINADTPSFDLDINNDARTTNIQVDSTARIDNIIPRADGTITTVLGPINIMPQTAGSYITLQRMRSDDLDFNDNTISGTTSNQTIELKPSGTGTVEAFSSTNIYGNLGVTGNINIDGDLSKQGNIILGDELYNPITDQGDTVEFVPEFSQSILPGNDNLWDLGRDQLDSSPRRWDQVYVTDNLSNADAVTPLNAYVSDQMHLDGVNNQIFATQSNDDFVLAPDTGIVYIERTRWQEITASSSTASISGTTLTVGGTITGSFIPGTVLTGVGILPGTVITGSTTGSDSSGVYTVNINYDSSGSNPDPTGTISITGSVDVIENLTNIDGGSRMSPETPLSFRSTGIGYLRFMGNSGVIIPAGDDTTRPQNLSNPVRPELGDTRWNTDEEYLESFSGKINIVTATGVVTGLPNQSRANLSGTTNGAGTDARFTVGIASGSIGTVTIDVQGQGYLAGDTITILGTAFTGGSTPLNDVTITVGAQIKDGYEIATGGGAEVDVDLMEDLGNEYSLILA